MVVNITEELFLLGDKDYKEFHSKLIPNVSKDRIIGVRTPQLRQFAKKVAKTPDVKIFISTLPHRYYDEDNLHAFIIEGIKDFDESVEAVERFLPYVDNWATCDMLNPTAFSKNTDRLLPYIEKWIKSRHVYTVRYAIGLLMRFFLNGKFKDDYAQMAASLHSDEYYINMMIAWYFATALAKNYDEVLPYLTQRKLDKWIHNKTIQKAVESRRISEEQKKYLKTLKIPKGM